MTDTVKRTKRRSKEEQKDASDPKRKQLAVSERRWLSCFLKD